MIAANFLFTFFAKTEKKVFVLFYWNLVKISSVSLHLFYWKVTELQQNHLHVYVHAASVTFFFVYIVSSDESNFSSNDPRSIFLDTKSCGLMLSQAISILSKNKILRICLLHYDIFRPLFDLDWNIMYQQMHIDQDPTSYNRRQKFAHDIYSC